MDFNQSSNVILVIMGYINPHESWVRKMARYGRGIDTFLTPAGHAHDDEFGRSPQRRPTSRSRNEASAKSLAQDVFITDAWLNKTP